MKNNKILAIIAAMMMVATIAVPFVGLGEQTVADDEIRQLEDIDDLDIPEISDLFADILNNNDGLTLDLESELESLLKELTSIFDEDTPAETKDVKEETKITIGKTVSFTNGNIFNFTDKGCYIFESGSTLIIDGNFTLTGVGNAIIVMEAGSMISANDMIQTIPDDEEIDISLKGSLTVVNDMSFDVNSGINISATSSVDLSKDGVFEFGETSIVGTDGKEMEMTTKIAVTSSLIDAIQSMDEEKIKEALLDKNNYITIDGNVNIPKITESTLEIFDIKANMSAKFVAPSSLDSKDNCISAKITVSMKFEEDGNATEIKISAGMTAADLMGLMGGKTMVPSFNASFEINGGFDSENAGTVIEIEKLSLKGNVAVTNDGPEPILKGNVNGEISGVSIDVSNEYGNISTITGNIGNIAVSAELEGNPATISEKGLLTFIKDGSFIKVTNAEVGMEYDDHKALYSVANAEIKLTKGNYDVSIGNITMNDTVMAGDCDYLKLNADNLKTSIPATQSDNKELKIDVKKLSVEIKYFGKNAEQITLDNATVGILNGGFALKSGSGTLTNANMTLYPLTIEKGANITIKDSTVRSLTIEDIGSVNGNILLLCNEYDNVTIGDEVDISFEDCSNVTLSIKVDSKKVSGTISPSVGCAGLEEKKAGTIEYVLDNDIGKLTNFIGVLTASAEPKEYVLTENDSAKNVKYGEVVELTIPVDKTKGVFSGWMVNDTEFRSVFTPYFVMPAEDVKLTYVWAFAPEQPVVDKNEVVIDSDETSLSLSSELLSEINSKLNDSVNTASIGTKDVVIKFDKNSMSTITGLGDDMILTTDVRNQNGKTIVGINAELQSGWDGVLNGKAKLVLNVTIPEGFSASDIRSCFVDEYGREVPVTITIENNVATIDVEHFSDYMIYFESVGGGDSNTNNIVLIAVIALIVIAVIAVGYFVLKKKG